MYCFLNRFSLLLCCLCFLSCGTVKIYKDPDKPILLSNDIKNQAPDNADSLRVLTFNIEKAEKIQLAISEFQQFDPANNIDIYLLQEMDEDGVKAIAKAFDLNYLYIPIVYNKLIKKDIGNAILTKGTIAHPEKLILPHSKWVNKRRRHVVIAEVSIHQKKILVYSVHTETVMMSRMHRMDQVDAIIQHAKTKWNSYDYILIGGDFNTLFSKSADMTVGKFRNNGLAWASATAGNTASAFWGMMKPTHDYIFIKGLKVISAGKIDASKSSDHFPVFATFIY